MIHAANLGCVPHLVGFPCVIKRPDSQFSLGVVKVHDSDELKRVCGEMFRESDLLIAQRYIYTPFDWRIGVLDGVPLHQGSTLFASTLNTPTYGSGMPAVPAPITIPSQCWRGSTA